MTAPDPKELLKTIQRIEQQTTALVLEYRWAHGVSHGSDRRGRSQDDQEGRAHGSGGHTDPTGNVVSSAMKQKARRACVSAVKKVDDALAELKSATWDLTHALTDPEPAIEPLGMDSLVTRAERAASEEAAARRRERGEDVPA